MNALNAHRILKDLLPLNLHPRRSSKLVRQRRLKRVE